MDHAGGLSAQKLLQKLRWCTLGPQFNWTERVYEWHEPYTPLPMELHDLAKRLCASVAGNLPEVVTGHHQPTPHGHAQTASAHQYCFMAKPWSITMILPAVHEHPGHLAVARLQHDMFWVKCSSRLGP